MMILTGMIIYGKPVKVHVLDENYQYVDDKLGLRVGNKIRLLADLKLYNIVNSENSDIYIVRSYPNDKSGLYFLGLMAGLLLFVVLHDNIKLTQENEVLNDRIIESNRILMDSLIAEVSDYIIKVAPESTLSGEVVVDKCLEYDLDPAFVLAQAQLESHFGTRGLARRTNSVWNVYAYDGVSYDGVPIQGKYLSPDDSIEPYMQMMTKNYLKESSTDDLLIAFVNNSGNRYASDKNYEVRLKSIYNEIQCSTEISKLYKSIIKGVAI